MPVSSLRRDISPQLQNILLRNGMEAHLTYDVSGKPMLSMRADGSPVKYAALTPAEASKIEASNDYSPTGTAEKGAYSVIASKATAAGFSMPSYIAAADTDPFVNIGLNGSRRWGGVFAGYPGGIPPYGVFGLLNYILPITPYIPSRYTPYRRVGGDIYENIYNPVTPTAKVEPGGLATGSNGIYYKGNPVEPGSKPSQIDIGQITSVKPWTETETKKEPIPLNEKIKDAKSFTPEAFLEVLDSHGVTIDKDASTITIRTPTMAEPITWPLKKETLDKLLSPRLTDQTTGKGKKKKTEKGYSIEERLKIINDGSKIYSPQHDGKVVLDANNQPVTAKGFTNDITVDMLNSKEYVNLIPSDEMRHYNISMDSYNNLRRVNDNFNNLGYDRKTDTDAMLARTKALQFLNAHPDFAKLSAAEAQNYIAAHPQEFSGLDQYAMSFIVPAGTAVGAPGTDGRVHVNVDPYLESYKSGYVDARNTIGTVDGRTLDKGKGFYTPLHGGKAVSVGQIIAYPAAHPGEKAGWRMSAVINGEVHTRDISEKDYIAFRDSDDATRLQIFDKNFDEVKIKRWHQGGGEQYTPKPCSIAEAAGVSSLNGKYSLVSGDPDGKYTAYIIESATAWHDKVKGGYTLSVRENGDNGLWQFRMTDAQYEEWSKATDARKAEMVAEIADFHDSEGKTYKAVSDADLLSREDYKYVKLGAELSGVHLVSDVTTLDFKDGKLIKKDIVSPARSTNPEGMLKALADSEQPMHAGKPVLDLSPGDSRHMYASQLTDKQKAEFAALGAQYMSKNGIHVTEDQLTDGRKTLILARLQSEGKLDISLNGRPGENVVNGQSKEGKMATRYFTRSGEHGRETTVGDIRVQPKLDADGKAIDGKYTISAVIDGNIVKHDIDKKTIDKFQGLDDYHKLKLFDKIFPEIKMHHVPGQNSRLAATILTSLALGTGAFLAIRGLGHHPHLDNAAGGFFYNNSVPGSDIASQAAIQYEQQVQEREDRFLSRLGMPL